FPDEGGIVCLQNSVSCGFSAGGSGVTSLDLLTGSVTLDGASNNQVRVDSTTTPNTIRLSLPQDIDTGAAVQFGSLQLSTQLSVAYGGTGRTTLTANSILYGNGTGQVSLLTPASTVSILTSAGGGAPTFQTSLPNGIQDGITRVSNAGSGLNVGTIGSGF